MVITASKWTRRKRCFCSKVVTNSTKNGLNGRVETRKFLSFAHIVDKIKRQFWHQFHPNPDCNIHKIRKYVFIIPQQMSWISLLFSKKRTGWQGQRASSKVKRVTSIIADSIASRDCVVRFALAMRAQAWFPRENKDEHFWNTQVNTHFQIDRIDG